jgi:hypothetical protein
VELAPLVAIPTVFDAKAGFLGVGDGIQSFGFYSYVTADLTKATIRIVTEAILTED